MQHTFSLDKRLGLSALSDKDPGFVIAVEGNIGCGKTTLLREMVERVSEWMAVGEDRELHTLPEPIDAWTNYQGINILKSYYDDPLKWAYPLESKVFEDMVDGLLDIPHSTPDKRVVTLMERSLYAARHVFAEHCHQAATLSDADFNVLADRFEEYKKFLPKVYSLIIYLRSDPELAFRRVRERMRPEETNITLEYLQCLHRLYDDFMLNANRVYGVNTPVIVVDANQSTAEMYQEIKNALVMAVK